MNAWLDKLYETFIETNYYTLMLDGLKNTLIITLGALLIGVVIGTLIAVAKYFAEESPAWKPLAALCDIYVTVIRGIHLLIEMAPKGANSGNLFLRQVIKLSLDLLQV